MARMTPDEAHTEAKQRIQNYRTARGDTVLFLDGLGLATVPDEVGKLKDLRGLQLSKNRLTTLPTFIKHLVNLEVLVLEKNQLKTLPTELQTLSKLVGLFLHNNP